MLLFYYIILSCLSYMWLLAITKNLLSHSNFLLYQEMLYHKVNKPFFIVYRKPWDPSSALQSNICLICSIWDRLECFSSVFPKNIHHITWNVLSTSVYVYHLYCPLLCSEKRAYFPQAYKKMTNRIKETGGSFGTHCCWY